MKFLLTQAGIDRMIAVYPWVMLLGFVLGLISSKFNGAGLISAFMAVWLGACGGSVQSWRTERGVWMLACLFFIISMIMYLGFQYGNASDFLHQRRGSPWIILDGGIATGLLFLQARFLLTVAIENRRISVQDQED